jgi:hypothetical protein
VRGDDQWFVYIEAYRPRIDSQGHDAMGFEFVKPFVVDGLVDLTRDKFITSMEERLVIDFSVNDGTFTSPGKMWVIKISEQHSEKWTHSCRIVWPKNGMPGIFMALVNPRLPPLPLSRSLISGSPFDEANDDKSAFGSRSDKSDALSRNVSHSITTNEQSVRFGLVRNGYAQWLHEGTQSRLKSGLVVVRSVGFAPRMSSGFSGLLSLSYEPSLYLTMY